MNGNQPTGAAEQQRRSARKLLPFSRTDLAVASAVTACEAVDALFARETGTPVLRPSTELLALSVLLGASVLAFLTMLRKVRGALPAERACRLQRERDLLVGRVRVAERTRITRELHDVLGHEVRRTVLAAGILEVTAAQDPEAVRAQAQQIGATGRQALYEMRTLQIGATGRQALYEMRTLMNGLVRDGLAEAPSSAAVGIEGLADRAGLAE
ncbi:histidine kinase [Streptomyces sp. NPDC004647]|uniref:histidine kinase n=1 Tax=Streptomyces sp. NPDC004647 TaxID=3154671 RepID=UPI0033BC41A6